MLAGSGNASAATRSNSVSAGHGVEQPGRGGLDGGDHGGDPLHAERPGGRLAEPGVFGLVQADHRRLGLVAAREQDLLGLGDDRRQRRLGDRGGVGSRVAEHRLDRGVAGDHVVADRRGEEDGRLVFRAVRPGPCRGRRGIRVRAGRTTRRQGSRARWRSSSSRTSSGASAHDAHDVAGRLRCHQVIRGADRARRLLG